MTDGPIIHGNYDLFWCLNCNVPVLEESCNKCGSETKNIDLTPPGDVTPSFKEDLIRKLIEKNYNVDGKKFLSPKNFNLMNPVPGLDDSYQIISDGMILGQIRFEPTEREWRILLTMEGGAKILKAGGEVKIVRMDQEAEPYLLDGANALAPGIIDADENIEKGDECIVVRENNKNNPSDVIATGIAKMNGKEMINENYGTGVSTRGQKNFNFLNTNTKADVKDVLEANKNHLQKIEEEAIKFIKDTKEKKDLPILLSFSGGKDSLAVLLLVRECLDPNEYDIVFNDTGIEFPETVDYVEELSKEIDNDIKTAEAGNSFWKNFETFGPPGRDYRWCCKTSKLGPISKFINKNFSEEKVLTFGGERKFESASRKNRDRIWNNPWVPNQLGASPIKNWRALEVWLYIFKNDLPHNELYDRHERIGCWVCPSSSLAELQTLKTEHPDLWKKLTEHLEKFADKNNLPDEWIEHGIWRWKNLSDGQKNIVKELEIESNKFDLERYESKIEIQSEEKDVSHLSSEIDLEKVRKISKIFGKNKMEKDESGDKIIFEKELELNSKKIKGKQANREKAFLLVKKAYECTNCGVCKSVCPTSAISYQNGNLCIDDKCNSCGKCLEHCPLKFKI